MEQQNELTENLEKLFAKIPEDGTPIGNISLQKNSGLKEDDYWLLRNKLIEDGRIGKGKGKGGSVYRLKAEKNAKAEEQQKKKKGHESDLYEHFQQWLTAFWAKDENLTWFLVEKTAHQGKKATGGKWT